MAKSTYKSLEYVEPPPSMDSSPLSRGVWSDTSGITVVDNTRDALRQAIVDALNRLPPAITETLPLRAFPRELSFDMWLSRLLAKGHESPSRLTTSWWRIRQSFRRLLRDAGHEQRDEASAIPRTLVTGTAEFHVEMSWRFNPGFQPKEVVEQGIVAAFTQDLEKELTSVYGKIESMRPGPSTRRNLDRDARWLVLREFLGLSDDEIRDYEAGYPVPLDTGQTLIRPDVDPGAEDELPLVKKAGRQERDTMNKAIKNLARDAGLSRSPRQKGRPRNLLPEEDPLSDYLA